MFALSTNQMCSDVSETETGGHDRLLRKTVTLKAFLLHLHESLNYDYALNIILNILLKWVAVVKVFLYFFFINLFGNLFILFGM